ncbi:MAG TPA: ABC transporter permease [Candidatus Cybelea sp.]|nr:ABC transporter permease [Candidatus Cybelea sp.]
MRELRMRLAQNYGPLVAFGLFVLIFAVYIGNHPAGLTVAVATTAANKGVLLALVGMAQTLPVLTGGLDLSVGMIFVMCNCIASAMVNGSPLQTATGVAAVLLAGLACGLLNGAIIVYGRLQPIITTLATGAIYYGIALAIRPVPGGEVNEALSDALTNQVFDTVPTTLVLLAAVVIVIWLPFRASALGRGCYAAGSSEPAAYMSGVDINRSKLAAYALCGLLAAVAGLLLTFVTDSGEASAPGGSVYTLNSIAAVVIGGTSLLGGVGGVIGAIFGAFVLRTIGDLLFVFDLPPLWQPLIQGAILLAALSLGAARVLRIRNRLELFG